MKTVLVFAMNDNPWVMRMWLRGLSRYAKTAKWRLEIVTRTDLRAERKRIREMVRYFNPSGMISSYTEGIVGNFPKELPVAWMDVSKDDISDSDPLISHSGCMTATEALKELKRLKLKNFAVVGDRPGLPWSEERIRAFREQFSAGVDIVHVFRLPAPSTDRVRCQTKLRPWLNRLPKPCGIFAVSDRVAANVLSAAVSECIAIPDELAVVGVDNDEDICLMSTPTLTSIATDWEKGGFMVGEALDRRMDNLTTLPVRETFGELGIVRRTSSCPGITRVDPRVADASLYIREHACEGIGVVDVVRRMGCSRRLAELRYLETTGRSIFAEIREAQFAKVLVLLAKRDVQVRAIADMCGWKSAMALRSYFEKRMNMTMREWRNRNVAG